MGRPFVHLQFSESSMAVNLKVSILDAGSLWGTSGNHVPYDSCLPKNKKATLLWTLGCHKPVIPVVTFLTPRQKLSASKGSIGHAFTVCIHTENQNQVTFTLMFFGSTWDFCSHWAHLRTPALSFNRRAAPSQLPIWQCLQPRSCPEGTYGLNMALKVGLWAPALLKE